MREGWTYKKLGEICNVINGLWVGKKEPFINIAVIRNTNFSKDCKLKLDDVAHIDAEERQFATRKLQVGDIIIEKSGGSDKQPVGRPVLFNIPNGDYSFSNFTATLRLKENNFNPQFLHYCLHEHYRNGETKRMQSKTTGLRNLDMKAYLKLPIPNIELAEQERIVAELDLLSSIIDKKKAQLKELDQLAQSIFYTMFGDPITNEKGWEVKKLGEVCEYSKTRIKSEELTAENYVGVENLLQDCKGKVVANKVPDGMGLTEYIKGDVLLGNIRPYLKKIWLANNRGGCNGDVLAIRIQSDHSNQILPIYIFGCLSKDAFFDYDIQYSKGEKMPRGDKKEIVKYPICIPPLHLQQEFASKVEAIEQQKSLIQQSIDEVQTLFDSRMDYWFG